MTWDELEKRIKAEIRPKESAILKADGDERRPVVSNDGQEIGMRTGRKTDSVHTISYAMIQYALETLAQTGRFDSNDFRRRFASEYKNASCRYTMTGGVLVELRVADRVITKVSRFSVSCVI